MLTLNVSLFFDALRYNRNLRICGSRCSISDKGALSPKQKPLLKVEAVNARPPHDGLVLFPRSLNLAVNDLARFREGFGRCCAWHRCGQPQPIFVLYRHDEADLASDVEIVQCTCKKAPSMTGGAPPRSGFYHRQAKRDLISK